MEKIKEDKDKKASKLNFIKSMKNNNNSALKSIKRNENLDKNKSLSFRNDYGVNPFENAEKMPKLSSPYLPKTVVYKTGYEDLKQ